jgi:hypothetical protein
VELTMPMRRGQERGQAMLELAIFGSIALLVLGALINYGLNADFTQQAMMESFRRATISAAEGSQPGKPMGVSYVQLTDRHVPNPSHPFTIGSVVPVTGQASGVTRNPRMQETADSEDELPRTRVVVQGVELDCPSVGIGCTTAGFRTEAIHSGNKDKYAEIYGKDNIDETTGRLIDSCDGEILDYDACIRQARQIVDPEVCRKECERGRSPGSSVDCAAICNQTISTPWYAQGASQPGGMWVFPALNKLFAGTRSMGLQPGYVKHTTLSTSRIKSENSSGVSTTSTAAWRDDTNRRFLHRVMGDTSGTAAQQPVNTTPKNQSGTTIWTTPWN